MIKLREYQSKSVEEVKLALSKYRRVLFQLPTGSGKCMSANTPILMFDGSVKMVQDVSVGDLLMGPDSEYRRVESTCRGREMMYRITPNKGDAFECNESHILALQYSDAEHGNAFRNVSVRDYLSLSKNEKHLLDRNRTYYKLLRSIVLEGQQRGELSDSYSVNDIVKAYALFERAMMYDWCLSNGEYSLSNYSNGMLKMLLNGYLKKD